MSTIQIKKNLQTKTVSKLLTKKKMIQLQDQILVSMKKIIIIMTKVMEFQID